VQVNRAIFDDLGRILLTVTHGRGGALRDGAMDARRRLGTMLTTLWKRAAPQAAQVQQLGVASSTLRNWLNGETAPSQAMTADFWSVVRQLQGAVGCCLYPDSEWEDALTAAQQEGTRRKYRQIIEVREKSEHLRFVRPHQPAYDAKIDALQGRDSERRAMNRFVHDSSSAAPAYLCWQADTPVGKTTLLADYVLRPPRGTDVLNFFVSPSHNTDTRGAFEEEMTRQITSLLRTPLPSGSPIARGVSSWRRLFAAAAARSVEPEAADRGRRPGR
jgi:hypothetical protein